MNTVSNELDRISNWYLTGWSLAWRWEAIGRFISIGGVANWPCSLFPDVRWGTKWDEDDLGFFERLKRQRNWRSCIKEGNISCCCHCGRHILANSQLSRQRSGKQSKFCSASRRNWLGTQTHPPQEAKSQISKSCNSPLSDSFLLKTNNLYR